MKNKNILLLGSSEDYTLEKMYQRGFNLNGLNTKFFHIYNIRKNFFSKIIWKYLRFIGFYFIRKKILNFIKIENKKYDLVIIFKGLYINKNFMINLKNNLKNTKIINIFPDNPFEVNYFKDISNKNILDCIKYFDHSFIYSKKILRKLNKNYPNKKFSYLPFAHDSKIHKIDKNKNKKKFDLSFIGTADERRYKIIKELKNFKIILGGDGWDRYKLSKNITYINNVDAKKFAKTINLSKVTLNILRKQNYSSHNMKTFEIPSMGGLMITERSLEQEIFFPENKACLMYNNLKELKSKIKNLKIDSKRYKKIIERGYKLAQKNSYKHRTKFLYNAVYN
ncbi:MAG: hypothetical protein CMC33_02095 [Flavobacteriaceae bacterium]|nr:hypothetical protein [Flavobacteriaceae bacterium]|tara:strand:- start:7274 stop:8284 length:1011 start_codon:yes stop_codon:yes gene_type:complete